MEFVLSEVGDHVEQFTAVFTDGRDRILFLGEGEESKAECVAALFKILEGGSWLTEFLEVLLRVALIKKLTPADVMWQLSGEVDNFESDIDQAKRMLREWPELVQPQAT